MVDPRIYRSGFALVAVAVIVFAFSLTPAPGAAPTNLAPGAVAGRAFTTMRTLEALFPRPAPGSRQDGQMASFVAGELRSDPGFTVTTSTTEAQTARGEQPIQTVTATRPGLAPGAIVVVSHRDSAGLAGFSGTAVLLDLAQKLSGQTGNHTITLISTSGSVGAAGATQVAQSLSAQPVDAVIVLGDLAAANPSEPLVIPWSNVAVLAPSLLRQTLGRYVQSNTGLSPGSTNLAAQVAHLAFPLTITEQGPFGGYGLPAVLLSLSGYRLPAPGEAVSPLRVQQSENAVLQSLGALDNGPRVPAPAPYLTIGSKIVPGWAVRLLVLALILPVVVATIDGVARARRRGHSMLRWLSWALASALPFVLILAVVLVVRTMGLVGAAPPGPVAGGVALSAGGIALICILALLLAGSFVLVRPRCIRWAAGLGSARRPPSSPGGDAAAMAVAVIVCVVSLIVWVGNPFAAALLVPALHLWLWLAQPGVRSRRWLTVTFGVIGLLPALLVAAYYAHLYGLGPVGLLWSALLLLLGGHLSSVAALGACLILGCLVSVFVIAARAAPAPSGPAPVTVRGPATYAGPGSLGGTESALGSRR